MEVPRWHPYTPQSPTPCPTDCEDGGRREGTVGITEGKKHRVLYFQVGGGKGRPLPQLWLGPSSALHPGPTDPALRADPYPKVMDLTCRLPLPTLLGVTGSAWRWFQSYLEGSSYQVTWRGSTSKPCRLSTGVPQSSVLGPLLFSLYTHSLGDVISSHGFSYHCYADDTQLFLSTL
ncbi:hypothetical protein P4O66_015841 [Electrophorus voltai]|uniref:Reverse transcriptase domain-containing protein n=1 Tax=Electrophorus voltai TaxID=2609070 RepID=A0AAD8YYH1_9TELE|nr:hypothetical protein P4O66_015841 [Electrophorus voltai]